MRAPSSPKDASSSAAAAAPRSFKPTELRVFSVNADRNALNMCDFFDVGLLKYLSLDDDE
tara:strand:+ start:1341 stop:1520 length:180 start_codon:yes stop_codon:yes gene_type:complete